MDQASVINTVIISFENSDGNVRTVLIIKILLVFGHRWKYSGQI